MVDTRVKPEYDEKREADIFSPEDDKNMRLSTSIFNHLANVILGINPSMTRVYAYGFRILTTESLLDITYRVSTIALTPRIKSSFCSKSSKFTGNLRRQFGCLSLSVPGRFCSTSTPKISSGCAKNTMHLLDDK